MLCLINFSGVGGLEKLKIRLNSASVEVEVEVEAELGKKLMAVLNEFSIRSVVKFASVPMPLPFPTPRLCDTLSHKTFQKN